MEFIQGKRLKLWFARQSDRALIYKMLTSPETAMFMFDEAHPAPTWDEFCEEDDHYYAGEASEFGSYLLIGYKDQVVGSISYACEYEKVAYAELDIWMHHVSSTGKGLGVEAINLLLAFINHKYGIRNFLIRPWIKNTNAIKAYKKCGFEEVTFERIFELYSEKNIEENGPGDYGEKETVNPYRYI